MRREQAYNALDDGAILDLCFARKVSTKPLKCNYVAVRFGRIALRWLRGGRLRQPQPFLSILHHHRGHYRVVHALRSDGIDNFDERVNVKATSIVEPPSARGIPATCAFRIRPAEAVRISARLPRNGFTAPAYDFEILRPGFKIRARTQNGN